MRKLILYFIVLAFSFFCRAQTNVYHPFPDSNAVWTISASGCCTSNCPGPPFPNPVIYEYKFSYFIENDTVLNSLVYHKLYQSGWWRSYCSSGFPPATWAPLSKNYQGAYRQDTALRKVYWAAHNAQECLLLDFTMQVGDTVQGCFSCPPFLTVTSIDSVQVGGNYCKRWNLSGSYPVSLIEGVGSTAGLLEPMCPFEYSGTLLCFARSGQVVYPDTATSCDLLTAIKSREPSYFFSIEPNPFSEETYVRTAGELQMANVIIQNMLGEEKVLMKGISGNEIHLKRGDLPAGIYILRITENGAMIGTKKIILE